VDSFFPDNSAKENLQSEIRFSIFPAGRAIDDLVSALKSAKAAIAEEGDEVDLDIASTGKGLGEILKNMADARKLGNMDYIVITNDSSL
jgi:hypothetical protein